MTRWFVSRHPGALEWAQQQGLVGLRRVAHLDPALLAPGARCLRLVVDLPAGARGRELSAAELDAYGARLEEFVVRRVCGGEPG